MRASPVTLMVFVCYFVVLIGISFYAYYKRKNAKNFSEEYYVAGRSFGPWIVAFMWATSWTSGGTFIGTPAVYYAMGWTALLWQAGAGVLGMIGMLAIGRRISRFAAEHNCVTLPDLFVERFQSRLMGIIAAISILVPILMPVAARYGIDPVHLGVVLTLNLMIGLLHPPLGMVLFVLARVAKLSVERTTMAILPWLVPLLLALAAITYIPELTLWLPKYMGLSK